MITEERMIDKNSDYLVTETTIDPKLPVPAVVAAIRARKTTGQLVFHVSQGGIQKIALIEKTRTAGAKREKIREILFSSEK